MRQRYTTLVLHLSSYIERKKGLLLTSHGWKGFLDVWLLIAAELLFTLVSLPLLLVTKPNVTKEGERRYGVRRVLTFGVLGIVIALWSLKIGLIFLREWTDTRVVNIREAALEEAQVFETPSITAAPEHASLAAPTVSGISMKNAHDWTVHGTGPQESAIALYVTRTDGTQKSVNVYLGKTDAEGTFAVQEDPSRFRLKGGEYAIQAFAYDPERGVKSPGSNIVVGSTSERSLENVLRRIDMAINIAVGAVLVGGVFLILLLL